MNRRIAKKIVQRVQDGATGYGREEVERAFCLMGLTPPPRPVRLAAPMTDGTNLVVKSSISATVVVGGGLLTTGQTFEIIPDPCLSAPVQMTKDESRGVLKNLTMGELRDMAKTKGLRGYSKMTKVELVEALLDKAA